MSGKRGSGTGQRPHTWKVGTDPVRHDQYNAWLKARSQAWFRKEIWEITFEQWVELWGTNWHRRGRERDCLMLMKQHWQDAWCVANAHLVNREVFHQTQATIKKERKAIRDEQGSKV